MVFLKRGQKPVIVPTPLISWCYRSYEVTDDGKHFMVQEAEHYPKLFHYTTLSALDNSATYNFYVKSKRFDSLQDAIDELHIQNPKKHRKRVRL